MDLMETTHTFVYHSCGCLETVMIKHQDPNDNTGTYYLEFMPLLEGDPIIISSKALAASKEIIKEYTSTPCEECVRDEKSLLTSLVPGSAICSANECGLSNGRNKFAHTVSQYEVSGDSNRFTREWVRRSLHQKLGLVELVPTKQPGPLGKQKARRLSL